MGFKTHDPEMIIQKGKVDCGWSTSEWQKITGNIKHNKSPKLRKQSFKFKNKAKNLTLEFTDDAEWRHTEVDDYNPVSQN
jgi:hypothetical protein